MCAKLNIPAIQCSTGVWKISLKLNVSETHSSPTSHILFFVLAESEQQDKRMILVVE